MKYAPDIEARKSTRFNDVGRVRNLLAQLENQKEEERVLRCILELSESDYDSVAAWVKSANEEKEGERGDSPIFIPIFIPAA